MAKIPYLHGQKRADGSTSWNWKPSPRLRRGGWNNRHLGVTPGTRATSAIITAAIDLNRQVEEWDAGAASAAGGKAVPKKWRFSDLIDAYRQSPEYLVMIGDKTRREYDSRMKQLKFWAQDGTLPIRDIDKQMVVDLKAALLTPAEDGAPASIFKCAAMLRVLRLLMRWAVNNGGLIAQDPTSGVPIPSTPSRTAKLEWRQVEDVVALARADGDETSALLMEIAFWTLQRRGDLAVFNRLAWRTYEAIDPRDRPVLIGSDGEVRGFRLLPNKTKNSTGKWVDAPIPPFLHDRIAKRFEASQWLFPHPDDKAKPLPDYRAQRLIRKWLDKAGYPGHQLRDLRRSGMSWMKDMGALQSNVFAISNHAVLGRRTIVDTYMPPDTRAAAAAIAAVLRTMDAIKAREQAQ